MDRFNYLVKKRQKALGIFDKAKKKLEALQAQINSEILKSLKNIDAKSAEIAEEHKSIAFLRQHHEATKQTAAKIDAILS